MIDYFSRNSIVRFFCSVLNLYKGIAGFLAALCIFYISSKFNFFLIILTILMYMCEYCLSR